MYSTYTKDLLRLSAIELHTGYPTSPISLKNVCDYLGLKYRKIQLSPNTCGMMLRSREGNFIFINEEHSYTRRRFSLAHEIGHYFLGHDSEVSRLNDENRYEEVQANRFASSLLMPDELFFHVHQESITIKAMANWLRVSPISVAIRCIEFGIRVVEAEFMRSEYYYAAEEYMAAAEPRSPYKVVQPAETAEPYRSPLPPLDSRYESVRRQNEDTLDRYRRIYGYE
ncbi:ImmA/IrrE family metallo-endopeptidase [Gorillibacterium sp. sgz5001074]|uniref:ImmA/IrrE family metallo-endopeptidase n=1 Tax=Gorillibacterium sp. sgz5001074 TaxID=3446695 RepID=UPI003F6652BD